uniref:Vps5 domain-containing protein n=1 Tax=Angiostrongylus cantonensis TaxID=6313 RepID=A0A0K0CYW0_ANGCA
MDFLHHQVSCLQYEASNHLLSAETEQQEACKKFEDISVLARTELKDLKKRRVLAFKKNLADLADLEIKHAKLLLDDFDCLYESR